MVELAAYRCLGVVGDRRLSRRELERIANKSSDHGFVTLGLEARLARIELQAVLDPALALDLGQSFALIEEEAQAHGLLLLARRVRDSG